MHLGRKAGSQGIGLGGDGGGRQGEASDLGMGGGEAQAQLGIGGKPTVKLNVLRAAFDQNSGADRKVRRLGQNDLDGLDTARGQHLAGGRVGGEGDIQVLFGEAQGARPGGRGGLPARQCAFLRGFRLKLLLQCLQVALRLRGLPHRRAQDDRQWNGRVAAQEQQSRRS